MGDFRRLKVWQQAFDLSLVVYRLTTAFPSDERYGLISQARRASLSVVANIAEGSGRSSAADFRRFLTIARGSLHELLCHMLVARELGYIDAEQWQGIDARVDEVSRMLLVLSRPKT